MAITREVTYFNSFAVKRVVEDNGLGFQGKAVWPALSWNPYGYPAFPLTADPAYVNFGWYVEESRIRGGYNNTQVDLGVRAYITETDDTEKQVGSGIIYSGIYNSLTGFNETNVFSTGDMIEKQLDPRYGDIQKMFTYDTNLIVWQNDKVHRALIDKDALYTAAGNASLTSSNNVIGQITPYSGEWGISEDPLSFAFKGFRIYFTDRSRGVVLRLSRDGITEISNYGMHDFFRDELSKINDNDTISSIGLIMKTGNAEATNVGVFPTDSVVVADYIVDTVDDIELGMTLLFSLYGNQGDVIHSIQNVGSLTGDLTAQITSNTTGLANGTYIGVVPDSNRSVYGQKALSGGVDPEVTVTVAGGIVTAIVVTSGSILYSAGDVLTLNGGDIGGTGANDVEITLVEANLTSISTTQKRIVFNKILYNLSGGLAVPPLLTVTFYKNIKDKIVGGFDDYVDKYVLSIQDSSEGTYNTLTFNDDNNAWTSFWDYEPSFMSTINNVYFTCYTNKIWRHYAIDKGKNYSEFYGILYPSSIQFAFNPTIQYAKVFNTIGYEGSNGWNVQNILSDPNGVQDTGLSYNDTSIFINSYEEGQYIENGITYRAGFNRKENKYMCDIINDTITRPGEVVFGEQMSGIKGYYVTVTMQTDNTTDIGGLKSIFAVSGNHVLSLN